MNTLLFSKMVLELSFWNGMVPMIMSNSSNTNLPTSMTKTYLISIMGQIPPLRDGGTDGIRIFPFHTSELLISNSGPSTRAINLGSLISSP